jgi:hypothetical protein
MLWPDKFCQHCLGLKKKLATDSNKWSQKIQEIFFAQTQQKVLLKIRLTEHFRKELSHPPFPQRLYGVKIMKIQAIENLTSAPSG